MKKQSSVWPKIRKFLNDIHLWAGLISGIIVLIVCFTGTVYVFNQEIRESSTPNLYKVSIGNEKKSITEMYNIVQEKSNGNISSVKIPYDTGRSYSFIVKKKEEKAKEADKKHQKASGKKEKAGEGPPKGPQRGNPYFINPYNGEVLGDLQGTKTTTTEFMQKMFSLHRWLLLDKIEEPIFENLENRKLGSYITGTATILFTLGVISGIIIWVPARIKSWKQGLRIKFSGNWKRTNHDLHNTLGFYSCILLFFMGITGPQWSFEWYRNGLRKFLGTYEAPDTPKPTPLKSVYTIDAKTLNYEDFLAIADKELNYKGDYNLTFPNDSVDVVQITKTKIGFFAPAAGDKLTLDQYSGQVLEKDIFKQKPFNERVSLSIKALHLGDIYGTFSKILYFIACLIATSLPVTGVLIWINKIKKKPKGKKKEQKEVASSTI